MNSKEYGKVYAAKLLDLVPAEQREALRGVLTSDDFASRLGEDVLMKADYQKNVQTAREEVAKASLWKEQLDKWHLEKQGEIEKAREFQAQVDAGILVDASSIGSQPDMSKFIDRASFQKALQETEARISGQGLGVIAAINSVSMKHFQTYGEPLDTHALINHCRQVNLPIDNGGYDSFTKEVRETREKNTFDKRIKEAEERGARKALEGAKIPYPVGGWGSDEISPLASFMAQQGGKNSNAVDSAVNTFNTLMAKKNGLGS